MDKEQLLHLKEEAEKVKSIMNDFALVLTCHEASYTAAAAAITTLLIEGAIHIAGMDEEQFQDQLRVMLKHFREHYKDYKEGQVDNGEE